MDFAEIPVRRVLIHKMGSVGDTIVALPCFHLIARTFPSAERVLLTEDIFSGKGTRAIDLLKPADLVHRQIEYTIGMRDPRKLLAVRKKIREFSPDVLISLRETPKSIWKDVLFFKACGIRHLIGMANSKSLRECQPLSPGGPLESEASRLARCLAPLGDARLNDPESWSLRLTPDERARAEVELKTLAGRPLIAVCVGSRWQSKDWGEENWTRLLNELSLDYPSHGLVLIGGGNERSLSDRTAASWNGRSVNLCGVLTVREGVAALIQTDLFVGHDSGPMHMAASVQRRCVAVFAAINIPNRWFPFGKGHRVIYHSTDCMGCGLHTCIKEKKKCMTSITVDEVRQAIHTSLDESISESRSRTLQH